MTETLTATAAGRLFSRPAAVASCVAFVLIGMVQAVYGPAVPGLREEFGLSPPPPDSASACTSRAAS